MFNFTVNLLAIELVLSRIFFDIVFPRLKADSVTPPTSY